MRTQCCVACWLLPALLLIVAVLKGFVLIAPHRAPLVSGWQQAPARIQAEVLASREAARLEFAEFREKPCPDAMPCLLWTQRMDDYGHFQCLSRFEDKAAWVPVR